jgi:hypothetical protein
VRYLNTTADLSGFRKARVDPLFARVGFAIRK